MKVSVIVTVLFLAVGAKCVDIDSEYLSSLISSQLSHQRIDLPQELINELRLQIENEARISPDFRGSITAIVNDYANKILQNIHDLIIKNGMDPMDLPGTTLKLIPTGTITLSSGYLQDISTLTRNGDVTATYSSTTRIMSFSVPIKFDSLLFSYEYLTKVLLLSINGEAHGKVEKLSINVELSFNFNTDHASLDKFKVANAGKFSLEFTGNGLLDWVTNIMTSVVTTFLHPIIVQIIQGIVKGGLESAVDSVNDFIDSFLHRTTASSLANQLL